MGVTNTAAVGFLSFTSTVCDELLQADSDHFLSWHTLVASDKESSAVVVDCLCEESVVIEGVMETFDIELSEKEN